jgi:hypothetical protein
LPSFQKEKILKQYDTDERHIHIYCSCFGVYKNHLKYTRQRAENQLVHSDFALHRGNSICWHAILVCSQDPDISAAVVPAPDKVSVARNTPFG